MNLRITKEEWDKAVAEHKAACAAYIARPLELITEEQYWYWLEVLPPLHWERGDGVERFCMLEFETGDVTRQVCEYKPSEYVPAVHASKFVLGSDRSTWITADMVRGAMAQKEPAQPEVPPPPPPPVDPISPDSPFPFPGELPK